MSDVRRWLPPGWESFHDVVVRMSRHDPEMAVGLVVDGVEMTVPKDSTLTIDMRADAPSVVTFRIYAGSLRIEHADGTGP